jgi:preprotein translocase subunit SecD
MNPNLKWKAAFIAGVVLLCIFGLIGLPEFPKSWADIRDNFSKRLKLGLDLQGGTHMILQVQVNEAINLHTEQTISRLTQQMHDKNIRYEEVRRVDDSHILVRNVAAEQIAAFRDLITGTFLEWDLAPAAGEVNGFVLSMKAAFAAERRSTTLSQAVETIRRRIDALGLTEPVVALHGRGENEILVQLPGEGDPTRAKAVIQAGGQLELRLVREGGPWTSEADALASFGGVLPPGTELIRGRSDSRDPSQAGTEVWYLLDRLPIVTGRDLRSATPAPDGTIPGRYKVNFSISTEAARRFGPFTEANIGKQLAIVLDRRVYSSPVIRGRIDDSGQIEGQFTQDLAHDLALVLRSGALPASIKYLEERTIGPSLGADSIRQGFRASIVSLIAVMVFMLFYYRLSGINAALALILNLIILLAVLAYFGAVLTLPGIAGVILTVGMGVDSNVLVFERIREELRAGKAKAAAVEAGFDRAFLTIIDTHVTTVVSCVFLFLFGTGPVQGFAVTLVIGLIANLFTALYVSRAIFHWHLARQPREEALSI